MHQKGGYISFDSESDRPHFDTKRKGSYRPFLTFLSHGN